MPEVAYFYEFSASEYFDGRNEPEMSPREERKTNTRRELIDGTVRTVANIGLENTTTDAICKESGMNVSMIYRLYNTKEELIADAFAAVDDEFVGVILKGFPVLSYESIDFESRCHVLFSKCWEYIMAHPDELIFYVRYYYSSSFQRYSNDDHIKRFSALFGKMKTAFPETTDVRMVLHHILDTLLGEARKQINDPKTDSAVAREKCFRLIFSVVKSYVREDKFKE